jgi:hypothetical protein
MIRSYLEVMSIQEIEYHTRGAIAGRNSQGLVKVLRVRELD